MTDVVSQHSWQHDRHHSKEIIFVNDFIDDYDADDMDTVLEILQSTFNEDNHTIMSEGELGQIKNIWLDNNTLDDDADDMDMFLEILQDLCNEGNNLMDVIVPEDMDKSSQEGVTTFKSMDISFGQVISSDVDLPPRNQDHCAAPSETRNSKISLDESSTAVSFDRFQTAMIQSQYSKSIIEDWDEKMGLSRVHSRTMMKSEKSRKKLYENVLPSLSELFCQQSRLVASDNRLQRNKLLVSH